MKSNSFEYARIKAHELPCQLQKVALSILKKKRIFQFEKKCSRFPWIYYKKTSKSIKTVTLTEVWNSVNEICNNFAAHIYFIKMCTSRAINDILTHQSINRSIELRVFINQKLILSIFMLHCLPFMTPWYWLSNNFIVRYT